MYETDYLINLTIIMYNIDDIFTLLIESSICAT